MWRTPIGNQVLLEFSTLPKGFKFGRSLLTLGVPGGYPGKDQNLFNCNLGTSVSSSWCFESSSEFILSVVSLWSDSSDSASGAEAVLGLEPRSGESAASSTASVTMISISSLGGSWAWTSGWSSLFRTP